MDDAMTAPTNSHVSIGAVSQTAERVLLPSSNCTHLVIYDEVGKPVEIRAEVGSRSASRCGPVQLQIGWWNSGRKTWQRLDGPMSITAACAFRAARKQRAERAEIKPAESPEIAA
jgi:hypothetical protein